MFIQYVAFYHFFYFSMLSFSFLVALLPFDLSILHHFISLRFYPSTDPLLPFYPYPFPFYLSFFWACLALPFHPSTFLSFYPSIWLPLYPSILLSHCPHSLQIYRATLPPMLSLYSSTLLLFSPFALLPHYLYTLLPLCSSACLPFYSFGPFSF